MSSLPPQPETRQQQGTLEKGMYILGFLGWVAVVARQLMGYKTLYLVVFAVLWSVATVFYFPLTLNYEAKFCRYATSRCRLRTLLDIFFLGTAIAPAIALITRLVLHVTGRLSTLSVPTA